MKCQVFVASLSMILPIAVGAAVPSYDYNDVMREIREGVQKAQNQFANCTASPTVCQNRYNRALADIQARITQVSSDPALRTSTQGIVNNRLQEIYNNQLTCGDTSKDFRACQKEDKQTIDRLVKRVSSDTPPPVSP